jgi:hypothetical protein
MMGIAIALNFILAAGYEAGGSDVSRYQVGDYKQRPPL